MQEYKIILTWEAIYDVTDIADYIEEEFSQQRADRFQSDLKEQMQNLSQFSTAFPRTQILYEDILYHIFVLCQTFFQDFALINTKFRTFQQLRCNTFCIVLTFALLLRPICFFSVHRLIPLCTIRISPCIHTIKYKYSFYTIHVSSIS